MGGVLSHWVPYLCSLRYAVVEAIAPLSVLRLLLEDKASGFISPMMCNMTVANYKFSASVFNLARVVCCRKERVLHFCRNWVARDRFFAFVPAGAMEGLARASSASLECWDSSLDN